MHALEYGIDKIDVTEHTETLNSMSGWLLASSIARIAT